MFFNTFLYQQTVEDEAARRIEFLVKKRVEEELEKRKDEIEQEVNRRVEAAKIQMEREMMIELEKRREAARLEEQKREVNILNSVSYTKFVVIFSSISTESNNLQQQKNQIFFSL